jgi:hypothetical protein
MWGKFSGRVWVFAGRAMLPHIGTKRTLRLVGCIKAFSGKPVKDTVADIHGIAIPP